MNPGNTTITMGGHPEDMMSLTKIIISDVYELSPNEVYYELEFYKIVRGLNYNKIYSPSLN